MVIETILASEFAINVALPFLLIFVLVFAVLQKSKLLGDDKRQIDALIALAIALIVIAFSWATDIITLLMPFLAVSLVVILVVMLLLGMVNKEGEDWDKMFPGWFRMILGIVIVIAVIIAVVVATGQWDLVFGYLFEDGNPTNALVNIIFLAIIVGAVVAVVLSGKGGKKESSSD